MGTTCTCKPCASFQFVPWNFTEYGYSDLQMYHIGLMWLFMIHIIVSKYAASEFIRKVSTIRSSSAKLLHLHIGCVQDGSHSPEEPGGSASIQVCWGWSFPYISLHIETLLHKCGYQLFSYVDGVSPILLSPLCTCSHLNEADPLIGPTLSVLPKPRWELRRCSRSKWHF